MERKISYLWHMEKQLTSNQLNIKNNSFVIYELRNYLKLSNRKIVDLVVDLKFDLHEILSFVEKTYKDKYNGFILECQKIDNEYLNNDINFISILEKDKFPTSLYKNDDPSVYLFYKGNIDLLNSKGVAIIGTRKPSELSKTNAFKLGQIFGKEFTVVSGLAIGCDRGAHEGCLSINGKTIAILGESIESVLAKKNNKLALEIISKNGLLISEYKKGSAFYPYFFAARDRLQSFLSNVVIVVEAKEGSGTLICVNRSIKDNKKVFALNYNKLIEIKEYFDINKDEDIIKIMNSINLSNNDNVEQLSLF